MIGQHFNSVVGSISQVVHSFNRKENETTQSSIANSDLENNKLLASIRDVASAEPTIADQPIRGTDVFQQLSKQIIQSISDISELAEHSEMAMAISLSFGHTALTRHVMESIKLIGSKIPTIDPSLLRTKVGRSVLRSIGHHNDENLHSDLLAALLNSDITGSFARRLFSALVKEIFSESVTEDAPYQFAKREVQLRSFDTEQGDTGSRRIDILVLRPNEVLVIENKIWSQESDHQTSDYAAAISAAYRSRRKYCLLLSPFGTAGHDELFRGLSYKQLFLIISAILPDTSELESRIPRFYLDELSDIILDFYN